MSNKHYHKYKLKDLNRDPKKPPYLVYICIQQDCSHHVPVELSESKVSECNRCGSLFKMIRAKQYRSNKWAVYPHCEACVKSPKAEAKKKIEKKLENSIDDLLDGILPKGI